MSINTAMMRANKTLTFRGTQTAGSAKDNKQSKSLNNISFGNTTPPGDVVLNAAQGSQPTTKGILSYLNYLNPFSYFSGAKADNVKDTVETMQENMENGSKEGGKTAWIVGGIAAGLALLGAGFVLLRSKKSEQQPKTNLTA